MPQPITSREYKMMLRRGSFVGPVPALLAAAGDLWHRVRQAAEKIGVTAHGNLDRIAGAREIRFFDTPDYAFFRRSFVLRERREDSGEHQVTLKFRHLDRYLVQERESAVDETGAGRCLLEQDIKPPFRQLFSLSADRPMAAAWKPKRVEDVVTLFPGLQTELADLAADAKVQPVAGFTAREMVVAGGDLRITHQPAVDAECALIVWLDEDGAEETPVAVELSFRYGDPEERFGSELAQRSFDLFETLQERLARWPGVEEGTKTSFLYRRAMD